MESSRLVNLVQVLYVVKNLLSVLVVIVTLVFAYLFQFHLVDFLDAIEKALVPDGRIENRLSAVRAIFWALLLTLVILLIGFRRSVIETLVHAVSAGDAATLFRCVGYTSMGLVAIHLVDWMPWVDFKIYLDEDGVFEMATAFFAILASLIMLYVCFQQRSWRARLLTSLLGVGFFLFGMEEISWGQRIVGWDTPVWLKAINDQGETTLHNLATHPVLNLAQALFVLICAVTLLILTRHSSQLIQRFGLHDMAHLLPDTGVAALAWVLIFCVPYTLIKGGELSEEILALFALAYAVNQATN